MRKKELIFSILENWVFYHKLTKKMKVKKNKKMKIIM